MAKKCAFTIVAIGTAAVLFLGLVRWETMVVQYHHWRARNDPEALADLIQTEDRLALKALKRYFRTKAGTQALAEYFYDYFFQLVQRDLKVSDRLQLDRGIEVQVFFRPEDDRFNSYTIYSTGAGNSVERTPELIRALRFATHFPRIGRFQISPTMGSSIVVDKSRFWCLIQRLDSS